MREITEWVHLNNNISEWCSKNLKELIESKDIDFKVDPFSNISPRCESSNITEWVTLLNKRKKVSQNLKELIKSKDIYFKTDKVDPFSNISPRCERLLNGST